MVLTKVTEFFLLLYEVTVHCWSFPARASWLGSRRTLVESCKFHVIQVKKKNRLHKSGISNRRLKNPFLGITCREVPGPDRLCPRWAPPALPCSPSLWGEREVLYQVKTVILGLGTKQSQHGHPVFRGTWGRPAAQLLDLRGL